MRFVYHVFLFIALWFYTDTFANAACNGQFYVGAEGGWAASLNRSGSIGTGASFQGRSFDARFHSAYTVGGELGYRFPRLMRTDVSYAFMHNSAFKWKTLFPSTPPQTSTYKAKLDLHLLLANAYLHINDLFPFFSCFDPYIGAGLGCAYSNLFHIRETFDPSLFVGGADIFSHHHFGLAARFGFGIQKIIYCRWVADLAFYGNYVEKIGSGSRRRLEDNRIEPIGPYRFQDNWIGTLSLGLKYLF